MWTLGFDIVAFGEGVSALWDEMHMYRAEFKETATEIKEEVIRKDDDRVAALEYAVEALEAEGAIVLPSRAKLERGLGRAIAKARGWGHV